MEDSLYHNVSFFLSSIPATIVYHIIYLWISSIPTTTIHPDPPTQNAISVRQDERL